MISRVNKILSFVFSDFSFVDQVLNGICSQLQVFVCTSEESWPRKLMVCSVGWVDCGDRSQQETTPNAQLLGSAKKESHPIFGGLSFNSSHLCLIRVGEKRNVSTNEPYSTKECQSVVLVRSWTSRGCRVKKKQRIVWCSEVKRPCRQALLVEAPSHCAHDCIDIGNTTQRFCQASECWSEVVWLLVFQDNGNLSKSSGAFQLGDDCASDGWRAFSIGWREITKWEGCSRRRNVFQKISNAFLDVRAQHSCQIATSRDVLAIIRFHYVRWSHHWRSFHSSGPKVEARHQSLLCMSCMSLNDDWYRPSLRPVLSQCSCTWHWWPLTLIKFTTWARRENVRKALRLALAFAACLQYYKLTGESTVQYSCGQERSCPNQARV